MNFWGECSNRAFINDDTIVKISALGTCFVGKDALMCLKSQTLPE